MSMMTHPYHKAGSVNYSTSKKKKSKNETNIHSSTNIKFLPKSHIFETLKQTVDSPYKNSLTEIKQISLKKDDSDDFKTSPITKKKSKVLVKRSNTKKGKQSLKAGNQKINSILKTTRDNFENLDVNAEDLQMALALSKSTCDTDNQESNGNIATDVTHLATFSNNTKSSTVLERFGFKSSRNKLPSIESKVIKSALIHEVPKKYRNAKFRYVTPILLTRTNEDREALITTKTSFILRHIENISETIAEPLEIEIFSEKIREWYDPTSKIIHLNSLNINDLQSDCYSVKSLNLPTSKCCCGCLLKNWVDIPGRDISPSREHSSEIVVDVHKSPETPLKRSECCVSPDIFDSDYGEAPYTSSRSGTLTDSLAQKTNNLTKIYKSNSGIQHFESICEDSFLVCEKLNIIMNEKSKSCLPGNEQLDDLDIQNESIGDCHTLEISNDQSEVPDIFSNKNIPNIKNSSNANSIICIDSESSCDSITPKLPEAHNTIDEDCRQFCKNKFGNLQSQVDCYDDDHKNSNIDDNFDYSSNITETILKKSKNLVPPKFEQEPKSIVKVNTEDCKRISNRLSLNNTDDLNVTDYISQLLNTKNSVYENETIDITVEEIIDNKNLSQSSNSQESIVISDEELNYSSMKSAYSRNKQFYDMCSSDNEEVGDILEKGGNDMQEVHANLRLKYSQETIPLLEEEPLSKNIIVATKISKENDLTDTSKENLSTPIKLCNVDNALKHVLSANLDSTPKSRVMVKTKDVTPMANYDEMNSPQIRSELDKFGFKPLKRRRGVQLLKYIYEYTHPVVNYDEIKNLPGNSKIIKRRKTNDQHSDIDTTSHLKISQNCSTVKIIGDALLENEKCEDLIFEPKYSKKKFSCAIPLQIVWYNFVNCNPELHKNILLYEPLHLEVVYLMLKEQSACKFKLEELMSFLDKKCITFRTSPPQKHRNKAADT